MTKARFMVPVMVAVALVAVFWNLRARAGEQDRPATNPASGASRYSVSTQVLPGQISMTVLYVTDSQTNKLYIYRALGRMDTSFNQDPELYRTYDLGSAGQKNLLQAK